MGLGHAGRRLGGEGPGQPSGLFRRGRTDGHRRTRGLRQGGRARHGPGRRSDGGAPGQGKGDGGRRAPGLVGHGPPGDDGGVRRRRSRCQGSLVRAADGSLVIHLGPAHGDLGPRPRYCRHPRPIPPAEPPAASRGSSGGTGTTVLVSRPRPGGTSRAHRCGPGSSFGRAVAVAGRRPR